MIGELARGGVEWVRELGSGVAGRAGMGELTWGWRFGFVAADEQAVHPRRTRIVTETFGLAVTPKQGSPRAVPIAADR